LISASSLKDILRANENSFPGIDANERKASLEETLVAIGGIFEVPAEDKRVAVQLTSELSKIFITVALGAVVALGTLVQLGWSSFTRDRPFVMLFCFLTGLGCFVSMYAGVCALSRLARSGFQLKDRWDLNPVRVLLNVQAISGVVAILLFVVAIVLSRESPVHNAGLLITIPPTVTATLAGEIVVRGVWSQLSVEGPGNTKLEIAPNPSGQTQFFKVIAQYP
jgi:heme A synthase